MVFREVWCNGSLVVSVTCPCHPGNFSILFTIWKKHSFYMVPSKATTKGLQTVGKVFLILVLLVSISEKKEEKILKHNVIEVKFG